MTVLDERHHDVAVITLHNPPMNGLDLNTRQAFVQALERAHADVAVKAIVITGAGHVFSSGADIKEFGTPKAYQDPHLIRLIDMVEASPKPVVAAMHSLVMGGGLELSLGCHYRLAAPGTRLALPEVKLGLIPGAGGTQRLPRAIGVEPALQMIVSGEPVLIEALAQRPGQKLMDQLTASPATLMHEAIGFARRVVAQPPAQGRWPRLRDMPCHHPQGNAFFEAARDRARRLAPHQPAPVSCIDAVQAATIRPFDDGMAFERERFVQLMASPESRALRHLFMAERAAGKIPGVPSHAGQRSITQVAVVGAGAMGTRIAVDLLRAGLRVQMLDLTQAALDRAIATVRAQPGLAAAQLSTTLRYPDLAQADLVIEAVVDDSNTKAQVFRQLDAVIKPGAILASCTSSPDLNPIAQSTQRPHDVVGLHAFSLAQGARLLEVVRTAHTAHDVLGTVISLGKKIGKTCVVSGVGNGSIGHRLFAQHRRQAEWLLEQGCSPAHIDRAMQQFGDAIGPCRLHGLSGPDPAGATRPPPLADDQVVQHMVYALVNEAARLLEEGIASRPSDIDIVCVAGAGFPMHRGGPMHYADGVGLAKVAETMQEMAQKLPALASVWQPAPLIQRLVASGQSFAHLNR